MEFGRGFSIDIHRLAMIYVNVNNKIDFLFNFVIQGGMKIMIGIRVEPELKEKLQELADEENRNLSNFITNAILTYLKEHKNIDFSKKGNN